MRARCLLGARTRSLRQREAKHFLPSSLMRLVATTATHRFVWPYPGATLRLTLGGTIELLNPIGPLTCNHSHSLS